ncbi:RagB/SusD family nutrient uptake outer membrane protein [Draconibacterium sp. IB214405]|uniref:RagB/SusD family nutrient uptake outer membrane protein n=1 Tax=Draconibacterium sp. IB214405 TaxID=3097352 RepID=UPI002A137F83|nr:RagB/SusD family nutrient uptake outer membrane protein [Draconibacterium sp. IB214405]MDX8340137.1 RagB/SusD family nutrient uptake outer membrane protein [Draconibacterium sp. IB214405]
MKNILGSILVLTLIIATTSCDDILDQKAVDAFNEESVFEDLNLTKAYLGRCYDFIGVDNNMLLGLREDLLSGATDELLCIHRPSGYPFLKGNMSPDELGHFGNWRFNWISWSLYSNIKNVNVFLANAENVPTENANEEDDLATYIAEAYYIRAFDYVNLMRSYGGLVLVDQPFELGEDFLSINRSSLDATLDFILADLDKAIAGLGTKDEMEQGRATKGAAAALKSRILSWSTGELMHGSYSTDPLVSFQSHSRESLLAQAQTVAKAIMDGNYGDYSLTGGTDDPPSPLTDADVDAYSENFSSIFTQKGEWNDEAIWGVQHLQAQGNRTTQNRWWGPNGYHNWGNNGPNELAVREFEMADGSSFVWDKYTPGDIEVRKATAAELEADPEMNPYVGREPRFYATVLFDGAKWIDRPTDGAALDPEGRVQTGYYVASDGSQTAGLDTRQGPIEAWNGTKNGYYIKKYQDPATVGQYFNNENAWIEMRYAEVVLDYAEACIELNEVEKGMDALNMIRNRAGLPDKMTTSQAEAREWYRHERMVEFFGEGDRWYMIRKWMIAGDVIKTVHPIKIYHYEDGSHEWFYDTSSDADARSWNEANYWLPISRTEINKAPQLDQNPGYN